MDPLSPPTPEVAFSQHSGGPERQTGHWELALPAFGIEIGKYSASAIRQSDGSVAGQFQLREVSADPTVPVDRIHGETTCLATLPDGTARAGGVITHAPTRPGFEGREAVWNVRDNGEGADSPPDLASDIRFGFLPEENIAEQFCAGQFGPAPLAMFPIQRGNVQVVSP